MTILKNDPVITVLLPVYNAQLYVRDAVESILLQTFRDFELIIIDDGSADESPKILDELSRLDSRIVVISRNNRGIVESLNEGLGLARGKWIARMDADDISMSGRFEKQLDFLMQTGVDMCGTWVRHFGTAGRRVIKYPVSDEAIKIGLLFGSCFAHPSVMMRTDLVKAQKYNKAWDGCEDYDLWERAAAAGWKMANVPDVLLMYRQHNSQISKVAADVQQCKTNQVRARFWRKFCMENGFNTKCVDSIIAMREDRRSASIDIELVDQMFVSMLRSSAGEAKGVLFDHITRLYIRACADYPRVLFKWRNLNAEFRDDRGILKKLMFFIVSKFRIRPDGIFFEILKKVFFLLRGGH